MIITRSLPPTRACSVVGGRTCFISLLPLLPSFTVRLRPTKLCLAQTQHSQAGRDELPGSDPLNAIAAAVRGGGGGGRGGGGGALHAGGKGIGGGDIGIGLDK